MAEIEKIKYPGMKIIGVELNLSKDDLENDLNERNFCSDTSKCEILQTYKNEKTFTTITVLVSPELYIKIISENGTIFIGHHS